MTKNLSVMATLRVRQGGKCCYCEKPMVRFKGKYPAGGPPANAETVEHLRRRADGGTNRRDNLALACHDCNQSRGNVDWLTYKSLKMGELQVAA